MVPPSGGVVETPAPMERQNFHGWAASQQSAMPRSRKRQFKAEHGPKAKLEWCDHAVHLGKEWKSFANVVRLNGIFNLHVSLKQAEHSSAPSTFSVPELLL